jgi:hypothetical protein
MSSMSSMSVMMSRAAHMLPVYHAASLAALAPTLTGPPQSPLRSIFTRHFRDRFTWTMTLRERRTWSMIQCE